MRYILVISPQPLSVDPGRGFLNTGGVWFDAMGSDISDWTDEPEKFQRLKAMGPERVVYAVHWKDLAILKAILADTIASDDVIVDDDFDLFVTGKQFVELAQRNPDNLWWLGGQYA